MNIQDALIWEDEAILAVNKPAGLRSITDGYDPTLPHLSGLLSEVYGQVWTVHRLDKDTSGIILFARSAEAHRSLNDQFMHRETRKEYRAISMGYPEWETTSITLPLRTNGDRKHRTIIDHQYGKPAETSITVIQSAEGFTLLSAFPRTGYTHQIRAHLAAVGLPLLADPLYRSLKPENQLFRAAQEKSQGLPIKRVALHALRLTFQHPLSGDRISLEAPFPIDFINTLSVLFPGYDQTKKQDR